MQSLTSADLGSCPGTALTEKREVGEEKPFRSNYKIEIKPTLTLKILGLLMATLILFAIHTVQIVFSYIFSKDET